MFSVNNFYNYLSHYLTIRKKDAVIKSFHVNGSRLLKDIIIPSYQTSKHLPYRYAAQIAMFDQEPIEMEYFTDWINFDPKSFPENYEYNQNGYLYKTLSPEDFIFRHFSSMHPAILCHSERNSPEVKLFEQNGFKTVHYFYHGLIAQDWFRHWTHYTMETSIDAKRFGMYCRDATGSRKYRLDLLNRLIPFRDNLYYNLQDPIYHLQPMLNVHYNSTDEQYESTASATIVPEDCQKFDIQLVPETLFNTQKTHLTEKVFKPIAMEQPFIIIGPPNSLAYLKSYGFKTFDKFWDESYDTLLDADERMDAIMKLIDTINKMDSYKYNSLLRSVRGIAKFNRKRFSSGVFSERILEELHTNLDKAFSNEEGTFLKYLDSFHQAGLDISDYNRKRILDIIEYLESLNPGLAVAITAKYKHLM